VRDQLFEFGGGSKAFIFTHGGFAYFFDPSTGLSLNNTRTGNKEFVNVFSALANGLKFEGLNNVKAWGIVYEKFKQFYTGFNWNDGAIRDEFVAIQSVIAKLLDNKAMCLVNNNNNIMEAFSQ
jgi:hypothetical protein